MTDQTPVGAAETCTNCGTEVPAGSAVCPVCGSPASRRCPECGVQPALADRVCANCGAALAPPPAHVPPSEWLPHAPGAPGGPLPGAGPRFPGRTPVGSARGPWATGPRSQFGAPLSAWWPRAGAMLLDVLVLIIPTLVVESIAAGSAATSPSSTGVDTAALAAAVFVSGLYFGILNGTGRGQTLGNRAAGIGVRDARSGAVVGLGRSLARWLVRYVLYILLIPGLLSDLWPLWDPQRQTLADKVAGTVMVRVVPGGAPSR